MCDRCGFIVVNAEHAKKIFDRIIDIFVVEAALRSFADRCEEGTGNQCSNHVRVGTGKTSRFDSPLHVAHAAFTHAFEKALLW